MTSEQYFSVLRKEKMSRSSISAKIAITKLKVSGNFKMTKILIGPAGTGGAELENFIALKEKGLDAVEIEFTYSVWMKKEQADAIRELNKKLGLKFSIHASYFVNLNSEDKAKIGASRARILKAMEIGTHLGAKYVVFHPGFYQKSSKEETYKAIKEQIEKIMEEAKKKGYTPLLAPETTGKASQFGDLDELIKLKKETGCSICVDFSHLKARYAGKIDYDEVCEKLSHLGHIHCHFSGIEYTAKGERRHLLTETKDIEELFKYLKKYKIDCTIINESPDPEGDALKMKKLL
jgi:deoxyribonuclease-4